MIKFKNTVKSLIVLSLISLVGCGANSNESNANSESTTGSKVLKVAVVGENNEQFEPIKERLAKENIDLQLVKFSDYTVPNQALADGQVDLNAFQHYAFFEDEIKSKGYDLTAIGETFIAQLNLFSDKIKSVDELKEGDSIAIPNDVTNGGRALKVLESAGIIQIDSNAGASPTVSDITANPLNIDIIEVDASQTVVLLPDVTAAVINGNYAIDAGIDPAKDAIYVKDIDPSDHNYINIIAARTEDKDNEIYKKFVEAYQTDEVAQIIDEVYKGAYKVVWETEK